MSLIISLRVADGIVIATDSQSTTHKPLEIIAEQVQKDGEKSEIIQFPPIPIPTSASSSTQKLFPFMEKYAISAYGSGIINQKSIYYHINDFEQKISSETDKLDLKKIINLFIEYMSKELENEQPNYKKNSPEGWTAIGLHFNGFELNESDKISGVTYHVEIGKKNQINRHEQIGCTVGGEMKIVQSLWELGKQHPDRKFQYTLFSLQDAIDFSKFLIRTTSTFQRFSRELLTVGGDIDIALLTPHGQFLWIKQKPLMKLLYDAKHCE